jgi:hypothetical protein
MLRMIGNINRQVNSKFALTNKKCDSNGNFLLTQ